MIDDLFLEIADACEANPFELVLILSKRQEQAVGSIFNREKSCLIEMDAGALLKDLFLRQLQVVPEGIKGLVESKLEGRDVAAIVAKALKGRRLLIHYGSDDELIVIEVTKNKKKRIDLDEFFDTLEF